jgi:hypothetical protein
MRFMETVFCEWMTNHNACGGVKGKAPSPHLDVGYASTRWGFRRILGYDVIGELCDAYIAQPDAAHRQAFCAAAGTKFPSTSAAAAAAAAPAAAAAAAPAAAAASAAVAWTDPVKVKFKLLLELLYTKHSEMVSACVPSDRLLQTKRSLMADGRFFSLRARFHPHIVESLPNATVAALKEPPFS